MQSRCNTLSCRTNQASPRLAGRRQQQRGGGAGAARRAAVWRRGCVCTQAGEWLDGRYALHAAWAGALRLPRWINGSAPARHAGALAACNGTLVSASWVQTSPHCTCPSLSCTGLLFLAAQGASEEDAGWLMTYVTDEDSLQSELVSRAAEGGCGSLAWCGGSSHLSAAGVCRGEFSRSGAAGDARPGWQAAS